MRITRITGEHARHVLMQGGMRCQETGERYALLRCGQLTMHNQIGGFDKVGFFGKLFYRITAITQDACFAIDKSNAAFAGTRVSITFIVGNKRGVLAQTGNIYGLLILGPDDDREFDFLISKF